MQNDRIIGCEKNYSPFISRIAAESTQDACSSAGEATKDAGSSVCGMCERAVGDTAIGCDRCSDWFCPSEMCTGLPENAIALIASLREENSVLFVCTGCRVNPGPGTWTEKHARKKGEVIMKVSNSCT